MKRLAVPLCLVLAVLTGTPVLVNPIIEDLKAPPLWRFRADGYGGQFGWAGGGLMSGGAGEGRDARWFDGRERGGVLRVDQAPLRYLRQLLQVLCGRSGCSARQHRAALPGRPCSPRSRSSGAT